MLTVVGFWADPILLVWALARAGAHLIRSLVLIWILIECGLGFYRVYLSARGSDYPNYIAQHGEYRRHDWEVRAFEGLIAGQSRPVVWLAIENRWVAEYLNLAFGSAATVVDLYGVHDRNGDLVARQNVAGAPSLLVVEKSLWWNRDYLAESIVAQNNELALVQMSLGPTHTPVLLRFDNPNGEESGVPSTRFFWMGTSPTQWTVVAPSDEHLVLRGQFTRGPSLSDAGKTVPMLAFVRPLSAPIVEAEPLEGGEARLPVARGLNELLLQEVDGSVVGLASSVDQRTLTIGVSTFEASLEPR
jgi:hypothetical protein